MTKPEITRTDGKMPFDSQEEYEAACKAVEGRPMTPYQSQTTDYINLIKNVLDDAMIWCPSEYTNDAPCKVRDAKEALERLAEKAWKYEGLCK